MGLTKCAVNGCQINSLPRHRFPNFKKDSSRFQEWLDILQDENLKSKNPEEVYAKKRICHNHFEEKYISPGTNRLHIDALPTLFVPNGSASGTENLLLPPDIKIEVPSLYILEEKESEETPAGTRALETNSEISLEQCEYSNNECLFLSSAEETPAGTRALETNSEISLEQCESSNNECLFLSSAEETPAGTSRAPETTNAAISPALCYPNHHRKNISLKSSKERRLNSTVRKLSQQLRRVKRVKDDFKRRLNLANKAEKKLTLQQKLSLMNPMAATFIRCQLREAGRSGKQHRFTAEDKIMAHALLKESPRSYEFLSKIFALPSRSTLNKVL